jgi:hypothetical protein
MIYLRLTFWQYLILRETWEFHGDSYEDYFLLVRDAV